MPFLLMLFLTLACLPESWPRPGLMPAIPSLCVLLTWLGVLLEVGLAFAVSRRVQQLLQDPTASREQTVRGYARGRFWHLMGLFAGYALSLYVFGYGWAVQELWRLPGGRPLPGMELLLLAPFCVALLLSWTCFYDAERALGSEGRDAHTHIAPGESSSPGFSSPGFWS